MNISMLLDVVAEMAPDLRAVADSDTSLTLSELRSAALALAAEIQSLPEPGPVAFMDVNSVAFAVCLFASAYANRTFVPFNYRADAKLVEYYVSALSPTVVIAGQRYRPFIPQAQLCWDSRRIPGDPALRATPVEAEADAAAVRIFTSGTTANPKDAALYHDNLLAYVLNSAEPLGESGGASLVSTPNYHIATVSNLLTSVYSGRCVVFLGQFTPNDWLTLARKEQVTHAFVVPTMLQRIVDELESGAEPPTSLRTLAYGGAPASRSTVERALNAFGNQTGLVNAYGLTETSSTISVLGPDDHRAAMTSVDPEVRARLMSAGKILPGVEVKISEEGEVLLRGPQVSGAYGPDKPASDGWFRTGDLGMLDRDGYLFLNGRIDDMIIRGGENISPVEIEDAIKLNPAVGDAAVVGIPDPEWGQRIVAAVELKRVISPDEIIASLEGKLPRFKRPEKIVVMEALPRTDLGKLQRRKVRNLLHPNQNN